MDTVLQILLPLMKDSFVTNCRYTSPSYAQTEPPRVRPCSSSPQPKAPDRSPGAPAYGASTIGTIIITASASISAGMSGFCGGSGVSGLGSFAGIGGNGSGVNLVVTVNGASV